MIDLFVLSKIGQRINIDFNASTGSIVRAQVQLPVGEGSMLLMIRATAAARVIIGGRTVSYYQNSMTYLAAGDRIPWVVEDVEEDGYIAVRGDAGTGSLEISLMSSVRPWAIASLAALETTKAKIGIVAYGLASGQYSNGMTKLLFPDDVEISTSQVLADAKDLTAACSGVPSVGSAVPLAYFGGGYNSILSPKARTTLDKYVYTTDIITALSALNTGRYGAAGFSNSGVPSAPFFGYFVGGSDASNNALNSVEKYAFFNDAYSSGTVLTSARTTSLCAATSNSLAFVRGGSVSENPAKAYSYVFATDAVTENTALNVPLNSAAGTNDINHLYGFYVGGVNAGSTAGIQQVIQTTFATLTDSLAVTLKTPICSNAACTGLDAVYSIGGGATVAVPYSTEISKYFVGTGAFVSAFRLNNAIGIGAATSNAG